MANTNLRFTESTQFPPTHQGKTYVRSFTDATSATNSGLYQTYDLNTNELLSQYILVNNKKQLLSLDITIDDSFEMINNLIN